MSRTHHIRPRRSRGGSPQTSSKKPDETRRWMRRFRKSHDVPPTRDFRREPVDGAE